MNKAIALALIAAGTLAAAGCASREERRMEREANPGACPNAIVLDDAARAIEFNGDEKLENIAYTAEILGIEINCRYFGDEPIEASVELDLAFGRGPKGEASEKNFTYFLAVTRTNLEVIEKVEYAVPVKFEKDEAVKTARQEIKKIVIPRANDTISGTNFEVIVGLAVTPEQAIYNRSGKSLKFPNL